jgi:hypothetical protein
VRYDVSAYLQSQGFRSYRYYRSRFVVEHRSVDTPVDLSGD